MYFANSAVITVAPNATCNCNSNPNLQTSAVPTGIANVIGNKGGIAISFCFHDTPLCFVVAHFAAHLEETEARNQNFREIIRRIRLGAFCLLTLSQLYFLLNFMVLFCCFCFCFSGWHSNRVFVNSNSKWFQGNCDCFTLIFVFSDDTRIDFTNKFNYVFWCGDLNYRLGASYSSPITPPDFHWNCFFISNRLFKEGLSILSLMFALLALPFETVVDTIYQGHELELLYGADQLKNEMLCTSCQASIFELESKVCISHFLGFWLSQRSETSLWGLSRERS